MIEESQASQAEYEGSIPFTRSSDFKALSVSADAWFTASYSALEPMENL